ncbi:hypothetical protein ACFYSC_32980 [Streptosporangium sp. NPDC004379]|uniref:hypothetical protein n=1 Tax=Streptosporangium sp. NPDC004379 TaxID=3366189 RepID=UPI00367D3FD6
MLRVVVDPEVPANVADLMRRNGPLLSRYRAGWNPEPSGPHFPAPVLVSLGVLTFLTVLVTLLVGAPGVFLGTLGTVYLIVLACVYLARKPLPADSTERVLYRHSRFHQGRFLVLEDFDLPSRALLGRVQKAIDRIMGARVNALGMLDSVRNSVMLPAEEWEIARLLTKLSALRARHRHLARGGRTPEVAAAMAPLERALAASEAAVVARVEALERYARHVARADHALASRGQIEALLAYLPEYEQLVAETGASRFSAPEIGTLSEDAARLQQALRDSVRSAHEAFRYLEG